MVEDSFESILDEAEEEADRILLSLIDDPVDCIDDLVNEYEDNYEDE